MLNRKEILNNKGFTLIEVLVASTYLNNDIRYSKKVAISEKLLEITNNNNEIIKYYMKNDTNSLGYLVREAGGFNQFNDVKDVEFTLPNDNLVSVKLITDIENNKSTEFKITRLNFKLAKAPGDDSEDSVYDFLKMNNIFLYGGNLSISGSTSVNKAANNEGTIIIDNTNKTDLVFPGNNIANIKNIYINKFNNEVRFDSSTKLGTTEFTKLVNIKGDVVLNNGGAQIKGDRIFIDGDVIFTDSAKIYGKEIYIKGDVTFRNWSALLNGEKIYIQGKVTFVQNGNIVGDIRYTSDILIPEQAEIKLPPMPSLLEDNWYFSKGYVASGTLENKMKIFSNNYSFTGTGTYNDVIIVSKGDIELKNWMNVTGLLFAPNGKVSFDGESFQGVVVSKDGFYATNGGSTITYGNITDYINNIDDFPLR